ncbi:MAG: flagellar hook-basal body complex protein FliE [Treponema sp.]|nr:flagellar hook-basal body complex protein FliE [Candidatus Treponema equifaecale]
MNIMSAPEMTRTDPAHVGTAKLTSLVPGQEDNSVKNEKNLGSFESYLVSAVSAMNGQQLDVNRVQEQLITDPDSVDIHDVTTAMAKAQMSLSLAQTVIDRLVTGWNEISTTR